MRLNHQFVITAWFRDHRISLSGIVERIVKRIVPKLHLGTFGSIIIVIFIINSCAPKEEQKTLPKTLLFSPITAEYLKDTAGEWKNNGFDGFLLSNLMRNWSDDIWAIDGDSTTRGDDDQTLQRIKACNEVCRRNGLEDNFIKVAFYKHIPLWTDDAAWQKFHNNFREATRFAKMSNCRGIALDIEYVSEQYNLDWEGYDYLGYSEEDLLAAARKRGSELPQAMLESYPDMVFLNLPEGMTYYGPLATEFFVGMVQGMADANASGGLHLLTEHSYDMRSILGLMHYVLNLERKVIHSLDQSVAQYWKEKCSIALGGWPLGYYRKILDENGEFLGYSGREEKFGNEVVGSYADKSRRFAPEEFRDQYAGMLLGSRRYCWIYGHGATWWYFSDADIEKYGNVGNSALPVDEQLKAFQAVVRNKWIPTDWLHEQSLKVQQRDNAAFMKNLNFVQNFMVIGPFGCKDCNNYETVFQPEQEIDFNAQYIDNDRELRWQTCYIDPASGYLDFLKYLKPSDWVCAYAFCKIIGPENIKVQLRLGTNDTGTVWFNGERILDKNIERSAVLDDDVLDVALKNGENRVLIKVCNTEINWGLYLRITDQQGNPVPNLQYWP